MPLRLTNIFQLTTAPTNLARAHTHIAGWSESFWTNLNASAYTPLWNDIRNKRATLLPVSAAIVGFRVQSFTISGNKLLPGGATSGRLNIPGNASNITDLPQVSLMLNCLAGGGNPNSSRMVLRGMPDAIMIGGEYQPTPAFAGQVTLLCNAFTGFNFGFIGRDLAQAAVRVNKIVANVITLDAMPGTGLNVGDFIRFHRVTDDNGDPVKGAFVVTQIAGLQITVLGLDATLSQPSGTLRRDLLAMFNFGNVTPIRAIVKKVGRPFEQYRGRRSKTKV
jgi:hypothetical protein